MKRFFSKLLPVVLGMALLSSTTVFAETSAEAKAVYDEVNAKSQTMSDGNMFMHMNMMMSDGSDTVNMAMDMNILYKNMNQPEQLQLMSKNNIFFNGMPMESLMWYSDGYSYTEAAGQKIRMKMDVTDAVNAALASSTALSTPTDYFSNITLSTVGDQRILSYTMDSAKMNAYIKQVFSQLGLDSLIEGITINVRDVRGDYTLTPDNYYTHSNIYMYMDMSYEGETVSMAMDGQIEMINPGQPVEIVLPDPAGYADVGI